MEFPTIRSLVEFPTQGGIVTVKSDYAGKEASLAVAIAESNIREMAEHNLGLNQYAPPIRQKRCNVSVE